MPVFGVIAGATSIALAAAVFSASPASAEHYVGFDPAGDMVVDSTNGVVVAEKHRDGDIKKVLVRFLPHRLNIRVSYYKLRSPRQGGSGVFLMGFIRTDRRAMPGPYLGAPGGPWQWEAAVGPGKPRMGILDAMTEEDYQCYRSGGSRDQGMKARIDYRDDFVFVSYPRHCIAGFGSHVRPRWVRLSAASASHGGYFDHWIAPNDRTFPSWRHAFYATPRLHAG
jgi:hypothetical protein